jgi:hypothetical protein
LFKRQPSVEDEVILDDADFQREMEEEMARCVAEEEARKAAEAVKAEEQSKARLLR